MALSPGCSWEDGVTPRALAHLLRWLFILSFRVVVYLPHRGHRIVREGSWMATWRYHVRLRHVLGQCGHRYSPSGPGSGSLGEDDAPVGAGSWGLGWDVSMAASDKSVKKRPDTKGTRLGKP